VANQNDPFPGNNFQVSPGDPLDLSTSVAGEEDPGASVEPEVPRGTEGRNDPHAGQASQHPVSEKVCPQCGGAGSTGASPCPYCQGTGKVTAGIGEA
jgi:hypothetical protein